MQRFEEELKMVKAESFRVGKTFRYMAGEWETRAKEWVKRAQEVDTQLARGMIAACWRHKVTFSRLEELAEWHHRELTLQERLNLS